MPGTGGPCGDAGVGNGEVRRIGDVVALGAELQGHLLRQVEVLEERDVGPTSVRSEELAACLVTRSARRLRGKGFGIQPVVDARVGGPIWLARDIRPVSGG